MRLAALLLILVFGAPVAAQSTCTCTCFDGRPEGLCTDPTEVPICTPDICPRKPSVLTPLPPLDKKQPVSKSELVWNEKTKQWDYRHVCPKN